MKIKELIVNKNVSITLVIVSAVARETRAKKPYLQLELFDGVDTIQGNYWDWTSGKIPEVNAIVDVDAQVTEYLGRKQLNIKALKLNTEKHLSDFEPSSGYDIVEVYKEAYSLCTEVKDGFLRRLSLYALEEMQDKWLTVPGAKGVHHAFVGGTLVHSLSVAKIARDISANIPESNDELCFVGGLLHDLGKLLTYTIDGLKIDMSDIGRVWDHTFIGAKLLGDMIATVGFHAEDEIGPKMILLTHIILSHHGKLEYGAAVPPQCIEAHIVHSADEIDATVQQVIEYSRKSDGNAWTDRIFTLSNKPHLSTQYVKDVFLSRENEESLPVK